MSYGIFVSTSIKHAPLSFVSDVKIENGMLFEMGDVVDGGSKYQVYKVVAPTGNKPVYVAGDPAWSYDTSSSVNMNEDAFIIPANTVFRGYPLTAGDGDRPDRFTIADYGIANSATIKFEDTIGLTAGSYKPTVGGGTDAFEGRVVKVDTQGASYFVGQTVDTRVKLVTIEVVKNTSKTA